MNSDRLFTSFFFFVEALYVSQKGCAVLVFLKLLNDVFVYSSFINKYSTAHAGTHTHIYIACEVISIPNLFI